MWVPVTEGSDRTGVLALTVPRAGEEIIGACETLGRLAGYFIATQARTTDLYNLHRRRRSLSLAASMQWDLLPPLVLKTPLISVAGLLEPAYEVGGDCFDYALNNDQLNVAIVDAMGHGVSSSLIATLAVGSYRHDRREGRRLDDIHAHLDAALTSQFPDTSFATGQLAQIDIGTGTMTWTNAGHPVPLLIRNGRVVSGLECRPTPPWGLGSTFTPDERATIATIALEPGDSVLFYTDGVIEAHDSGRRAVRSRTTRRSGWASRVGPARTRGRRAPSRRCGPRLSGRAADGRRDPRPRPMERDRGLTRPTAPMVT